jgi:hypothetical protein
MEACIRDNRETIVAFLNGIRQTVGAIEMNTKIGSETVNKSLEIININQLTYRNQLDKNLCQKIKNETKIKLSIYSKKMSSNRDEFRL